MVYLLEQNKSWKCDRCLEEMSPGIVARVYLDEQHVSTVTECTAHPVCQKAEATGNYCGIHGDGNLHPDCQDFETVH